MFPAAAGADAAAAELLPADVPNLAPGELLEGPHVRGTSDDGTRLMPSKGCEDGEAVALSICSSTQTQGGDRLRSQVQAQTMYIGTLRHEHEWGPP